MVDFSRWHHNNSDLTVLHKTEFITPRALLVQEIEADVQLVSCANGLVYKILV